IDKHRSDAVGGGGTLLRAPRAAIVEAPREGMRPPARGAPLGAILLAAQFDGILPKQGFTTLPDIPPSAFGPLGNRAGFGASTIDILLCCAPLRPATRHKRDMREICPRISNFVNRWSGVQISHPAPIKPMACTSMITSRMSRMLRFFPQCFQWL